MSIIESKKVFHINSRNRISGNNSNFTYKLDLPARNNFDHVCVLECSIPKSYYLVQSGQNTFDINESDVLLETITIPVGNYSRRSFQTVLGALLPIGYSMTYPDSTQVSDTGKFTFTSTVGANASFVFTTYMNEIMGFEANSTNYFVADSLESVNVINMQRETTLFIHSSLASNDTNNVLIDVFANGNPDYSTIVWRITDLESHSKLLTSNGQNTYDFTLTDESKNEIFLNGGNILITLLLYKKTQINNLIRDAIKYNLMEKPHPVAETPDPTVKVIEAPAIS